MTFGILRLGDAVQRWLRHPEPSSWSCKSTIREKNFYFFLKKTPHPSRFACHLLPQEKAGENPCFRPRTHLIHARLAFIAGVQTMRARICSAFSCDMFARVVWLKSWGAVKLPTFTLSFAACTCHAWFARLTRARRQWFGRRTA